MKTNKSYRNMDFVNKYLNKQKTNGIKQIEMNSQTYRLSHTKLNEEIILIMFRWSLQFMGGYCI